MCIRTGPPGTSVVEASGATFALLGLRDSHRYCAALVLAKDSGSGTQFACLRRRPGPQERFVQGLTLMVRQIHVMAS